MSQVFAKASSQYLRVAAPLLPIPGGSDFNFSAAGWFYATTSTEQMWLVGGGSGAGDFHYWGINVQANNTVVAQIYGGLGHATAVASGTFTDGVWFHAAAVFHSDVSRDIFLNGANKVNTTTDCGVFPANLAEVAIGSLLYTSRISYLDGGAAEVGIWSAALTDAEVAMLANGYSPDQVRPQSLLLCAPLMRDLVDLRGNVISNNNGVTVGVHPRIIHRRRRPVIPFVAAAAGADVRKHVISAYMRAAA